jgi:hypothetical protein
MENSTEPIKPETTEEVKEKKLDPHCPNMLIPIDATPNEKDFVFYRMLSGLVLLRVLSVDTKEETCMVELVKNYSSEEWVSNPSNIDIKDLEIMPEPSFIWCPDEQFKNVPKHVQMQARISKRKIINESTKNFIDDIKKTVSDIILKERATVDTQRDHLKSPVKVEERTDGKTFAPGKIPVGHKVWEIPVETFPDITEKQVTLADYEYDTMLLTSKKGHIYVSALNKKNALKKFFNEYKTLESTAVPIDESQSQS